MTDVPANKEPIDRYLDNQLPREADAATFARCDAVIALAPKLAESDDLGWAFDEARRLARSGPATEPRPKRRWRASPWPAWTVAGILAIALVVAELPRFDNRPGTAVDADPEAASAATTASITINQFVISDELARNLAEVEPVLMLANQTPVDSRSVAVLPFTNVAPANDQEAISAESIYRQVVRQLGAVPGIYVIDPATAAVYTNYDDYDMSAEAIAQQLGVRGIVEGRIASVNGSVRFELRFTDATTDGSAISEAIVRPTDELAMLEADIAATVVGALTAIPTAADSEAIL